MLLAAGCQTVVLTPNQRQIASDLSHIKPDQSALARDTPVIDIHTHTFNARDLPVQGIILGRRDAAPPWTWLVSDDMARFLAGVIVEDTEPITEEDLARYHDNTRTNRFVRMAANINGTTNSFEAITNRSEYQAAEKMRHFGKYDEMRHFSWGESLAVRTAAGIVDTHQSSFLPISRDLLLQISPFFDDLLSSDADLLDRYAIENGTNIQFRVSLMMDMGPTYNQKPHEAGLRSFEKEIEHLAALQTQTNAHMAYFVAYNPFRDNLNDGESLRMVQDAITKHYAYGVKLYPPAGYRPFSNSIPSRPWLPFTAEPGREWDARYVKNGQRISNAELDGRLLGLLLWCASNDIPVFVHSGYGEFQARDGYGQDMPNPEWWEGLLTNAGAIYPKLQQLRLCLGHTGGGDSLFGDTGYASWSEKACDLCRRFPNVYCEVGCLDQILDTNKQAIFAERMETLLQQPTDPTHPYAFATKFMYGSDWFMPIQGGDRHDFLAQYQRVFLLPPLTNYYKAFFLGNALSYLNAAERTREDAPFPVAPVVKTQLQDLLDKAKL